MIDLFRLVAKINVRLNFEPHSAKAAWDKPAFAA